MGVSHWDSVETAVADRVAHLRATWRDLGRAAGSVGASVQRVQVAPGARATPVHEHFHEEELFFVLGGSGWAYWNGRACGVGPDDVVLHRAGEGGHTFVAGDQGLDLLAFGAEPPAPVTFLERAGVMRTGASWVDYEPGSAHPSEREPAALPFEEAERFDTVRALAAFAQDDTRRGRSAFVRRALGRQLGALTSGLQWVRVEAGMESWPPHCHSAEEELFVVLEGEGSLVLGDERIPLRRGSVVARPPGTGVAHTFIGPLTYLAWGAHDPNDMTYYPRSKKVALRGLGVRFFVEPVTDYWEGEE